MDKFLVTMPRSEGDVLVRMKEVYESIDNVGSSAKIVRVPAQEAYLMKRKGKPYSFAVEDEVANVVSAFGMKIVDEIPAGSYLPDEAVVNQTGCTLEATADNSYTITSEFSKLEPYVMNYEDRAKLGAQNWLAFAVSTGEESIVGLTVNGRVLTDSDVNEAKMLGLGDGEFVYWIIMKEGKSYTMVLEKDGKAALISLMAMNEGD